MANTYRVTFRVWGNYTLSKIVHGDSEEIVTEGVERAKWPIEPEAWEQTEVTVDDIKEESTWRLNQHCS